MAVSPAWRQLCYRLNLSTVLGASPPPPALPHHQCGSIEMQLPKASGGRCYLDLSPFHPGLILNCAVFLSKLTAICHPQGMDDSSLLVPMGRD